MKKIFITYADENFVSAGKRIIREARDLEIFDECIIVSPEEIPAEIKSSPLWKEKRGGGYWIWKPWVIEYGLSFLREGDILFYADAGCQLYESEEWSRYFRHLKKHTFLFFRIGGKVKNWVRSNLRRAYHLDNMGSQMILAGTMMMMKKNVKSRLLIHEWLSVMLNHPEYVNDVREDDRKNEDSDFIENRHDQAVLSGILYQYKKDMKGCIRWEHFEQKAPTGWQAVFAARNSSGAKKHKSFSFTRYFFRRFFIYPLLSIKCFFCESL